ncbi:acyl-CoA carboxylase epsilon subunit [Paeniglutamicibacter sp. ORCA_105]|uniref:acyl-CoA carboxylase epsilon subunit n=1 Tax=Paeniglutamicibacter sp. ORCA_105 TaxID=3377336 RepID=UPI0038955568
MTGNQNALAAAQAMATQLSVTRGNPTAEEVAALAAVVSALAIQDSAAPAPTGTELRRGRLRRRRALSASPLPWKVGRH